MESVLSLQMLSTSLVEQVCGQSNVSCPSNQSCLSQVSSGVKAPSSGGTIAVAW